MVYLFYLTSATYYYKAKQDAKTWLGWTKMDVFLFSPVSTISVLAGVLSAEPPVRTSELLSLRAQRGEAIFCHGR